MIIGGGGILHDFGSKSTIRYYIEQAIVKEIPFFLVSVGIQTVKQYLTIAEARTTLGSMVQLLEKASIIFTRSIEDTYLLRSVLRNVDHKIETTPDIGYLYPQIIPNLSSKKKYITLIQTGSVNVNSEYIRNQIKDKLAQYPLAQLVVMNWGGITNPAQEKDFPEWNLFKVDTLKYYPNALIYIGNSISSELKEVGYKNVKTRQSDLTPELACQIVAQSYHVFTGRYHGEIIAKAYNVPFDRLIFSYKCINEEKSNLDIRKAYIPIKLITNFLECGLIMDQSPREWSEEKRNSTIDHIHSLYPNVTVSFIQSMSNIQLCKYLLT